MKGKLIKCNHFYALQIDSDIIAVSLDKETESHTVNYEHSLSLKNCQAIENGYDLDEMSKEETRKFLGHDVPENIMLFIAHSKMFQVGFQKAIEILGDKKFTIEDMITAMDRVWSWCEDNQDKDCATLDELEEKHIQLLHLPLEIDVEVVMDRIPADLAPGGWDVFPKLNAEGCIILKRVE